MAKILILATAVGLPMSPGRRLADRLLAAGHVVQCAEEGTAQRAVAIGADVLVVDEARRATAALAASHLGLKAVVLLPGWKAKKGGAPPGVDLASSDTPEAAFAVVDAVLRRGPVPTAWVGEAPPRVVATTLGRGPIEPQRRAVAAWRALGFEVASLHPPGGIGALATTFPDARFVELDRAVELEPGVPGVALGAALQWLRRRSGGLLAVALPDVEPEGPETFPAWLDEAVKGTVILGRARPVVSTGVYAPEPVDPATVAATVDHAFFDGDAVADVGDAGFVLGDPAALPWLALAAYLRAPRVGRLGTPVAYRPTERPPWSEDFVRQEAYRLLGWTYDLKRPPAPVAGLIGDLRKIGGDVPAVMDRFDRFLRSYPTVTGG